MRIAVLGDGLLGSEVVKQTGWEYLSRKKDGFDLTQHNKFDQYFIENRHGIITNSRYDTVVNCIAYTDTYSQDRERHWEVNYKAVVNLTDYCAKHGMKLVHISSDYVYTNSVENATEDDIPIHGNNWYSYTKLLGDSYVQLQPGNLVIRGTHKPTPFPYKGAWVDQSGNFDYVDTISKIYIQLIRNNTSGVYNVGTELKNMYTLAKRTKPDVEAIRIGSIEVPKDVSMNLQKLNKII